MTSVTPTGTGARERGQILPLFVLSMVVILAIGALLLDGASMLVTRRHLPNGGGAAARAGANVMQKDTSSRLCSDVSNSPPGAPRADIITAVTSSVSTNWPGFPSGNITITCPDGWDNQAVQVDLNIP